MHDLQESCLVRNKVIIEEVSSEVERRLYEDAHFLLEHLEFGRVVFYDDVYSWLR